MSLPPAYINLSNCHQQPKNLSIHLVLSHPSDNTKLPLFGVNIPILGRQSLITQSQAGRRPESNEHHCRHLPPRMAQKTCVARHAYDFYSDFLRPDLYKYDFRTHAVRFLHTCQHLRWVWAPYGPSSRSRGPKRENVFLTFVRTSTWRGLNHNALAGVKCLSTRAFERRLTRPATMLNFRDNLPHVLCGRKSPPFRPQKRTKCTFAFVQSSNGFRQRPQSMLR